MCAQFFEDRITSRLGVLSLTLNNQNGRQTPGDEVVCEDCYGGIGKVWYTRVDLPRDRDSRRKQKTIRLGPGSKAEAQSKEREVLRALENEAPQSFGSETVAEMLNSWLRVNAPSTSAQNISPKTFERYASIVRLQIIPHLVVRFVVAGKRWRYRSRATRHGSFGPEHD